jgi:hypothetical protein
VKNYPLDLEGFWDVDRVKNVELTAACIRFDACLSDQELAAKPDP